VLHCQQEISSRGRNIGLIVETEAEIGAAQASAPSFFCRCLAGTPKRLQRQPARVKPAANQASSGEGPRGS